MVASCCIKLWNPSGLSTTSKPATPQGIQLMWEWTLNWEWFSCCLCWGYDPMLPWWKLVIYKLVLVVMRICARWIPSRFKFLGQKNDVTCLVTHPFLPLDRTVQHQLLFQSLWEWLMGHWPKPQIKICPFEMDTTKFWRLSPPQYNAPTTAGFSWTSVCMLNLGTVLGMA